MGATSCKPTEDGCCATASEPPQETALAEPHGSLDYPSQTEIEPVHQEPLSLSYEELALRIDRTDKTRKFSRETSPTSDTQSRLSSTSSHHFELDRELLRGIPLKATLHGFGKMWTTSPTDLPDDDTREALWTKSRKTDKLDIFLSHTWHTPGWQKVLALLVQSGSHCFTVGWLFGALIFVVLELSGTLPEWWSRQSGLSMRIGGFLGSTVGLFVSPYLPWRCGGGEMCFFDVVSINQADPDLMQKGIYGLGGFLAASSELRILWSPPYLSRLWCVFELAAFRQANPTGRILLKPLFLETGLLYVILAVYFFVVFEDVKVRLLGERSYDMSWLPLGMTCCSLLPFLVLLHGLRRICHEKRQLIAGLRTFDLDKVDCKVPTDEEFIYEGIREWYRSPEAFVDYVRGPLADELTEPFFFLTLPIAYWLMAMTPIISAEMDVWLHLFRQGQTAQEAVASLLVLVVAAPLFCMNIMHLILFSCEHLTYAPTGVLEYCKTLLIWVLMVLVVFFFVLLAGPFVQEAQIPGGVIASATNAVIFYIAWRCKGPSD